MAESYLPKFVIVPENLTMREVERAVQICMNLGLLNDRGGYLLIPQGTFSRVEYKGPGDLDA